MPPLLADSGPGLDWSQTLILGAAILLGLALNAWRRRRAAKRGETESDDGAGNNRSGAAWRRSVGVLRETTADAAQAPAQDLERLTPGRYGAGATRDLTPAEIRLLKPSYAPRLDGDPDPGEIVWTWVPYAENDGRGKDRPVLIIARVGEHAFAGCYLSTKQHRDFVSVGTGGWDAQGRESFLAPDRVLRVEAGGMRREGQVLPLGRFEQAVEAVVRLHGIDR
ncbi:MAG: hypothetical protein ACNYNX_09830 [Leucobacter sp.]